MKKLLLFLISLLLFIPSYGQSDFTLEIVPFEIKELPSLHAYTFAQHDGKWLIIGGLTGDDIYTSYFNYDLLVIDPVKETFWTYPALWAEINIEEPEHLAACFSASQQIGDYLYVVGGIGHMSDEDAIGTYPYLTRINVPDLIYAILKKGKIAHCFEQIKAEAFRVTEATLSSVDDEFHLTNGRLLTGEFDEEGDIQISDEPTSKNIVFRLSEDTEQLKLSAVKAIDYQETWFSNHGAAVPQIFPDGTAGISMFFNEKQADINQLSWMNVFNFGYSTYTKSEAELPHYHSTIIPVYDKNTNRMHTIFISGCDDYLCSDETTYAPEPVEEMTRFTRLGNGEIYLQNQIIQSYLSKGKDALFLPASGDINGIIQLSDLKETRNFIGYIYGGATAPSPMFFNNGELLDSASNQLFKVYLVKGEDGHSLGVEFPDQSMLQYTIHIPNQ